MSCTAQPACSQCDSLWAAGERTLEALCPKSLHEAALAAARSVGPSGPLAAVLLQPTEQRPPAVHADCERHLLTSSGLPSDIGMDGDASGPPPGLPVRVLLKEIPPGAPAIALALMPAPPLALGTSSVVGRGVAARLTTAIEIALGEALERRCALGPPPARLHWGSSSELSGRICRHVCESPQPRWWAETRRYAKGLAERTLVPLEYVQLASQCLIRDALLQADSTGMALHPEPEAALNNGLEEVLERVGLAQLCSAGAKTRWDPTSFGEDAAVMETICRACGYAVEALATEPAPGFTACAVLLRRSPLREPGPALVCGAGGAWHPHLALNKALAEAYAQLVHACELWSAGASSRHPSAPGAPVDGFRHYFEASHADALLSVWAVPRATTVPVAAPPSTDSRQRFLRMHEVLTVDRADRQSRALGLSVVQVLIPAFAGVRPGRLVLGGLPNPFS